MIKYNKELMGKVFEICERRNDTTIVNKEYYDNFLQIPDKSLEYLIGCIITDRADAINKMIMKEDGTDNEVNEYIKWILV